VIAAPKKTPTTPSRKHTKRAEGATTATEHLDAPTTATTPRRAPAVETFITDPKPYVDKDPPDCDTCWTVRMCTRGRVQQCRWCTVDV
jgi:hypothetical protein